MLHWLLTGEAKDFLACISSVRYSACSFCAVRNFLWRTWEALGLKYVLKPVSTRLSAFISCLTKHMSTQQACTPDHSDKKMLAFWTTPSPRCKSSLQMHSAALFKQPVSSDATSDSQKVKWTNWGLLEFCEAYVCVCVCVERVMLCWVRRCRKSFLPD